MKRKRTQTTTFACDHELLDRMNEARLKQAFKPSISAFVRTAIEEFLTKMEMSK